TLRRRVAESCAGSRGGRPINLCSVSSVFQPSCERLENNSNARAVRLRADWPMDKPSAISLGSPGGPDAPGQATRLTFAPRRSMLLPRRSSVESSVRGGQSKVRPIEFLQWPSELRAWPFRSDSSLPISPTFCEGRGESGIDDRNEASWLF